MSDTFDEEPFELSISDELDLHTFNPKDVKELVYEYLFECKKHNIFRVRIIHGKGKSVLKKIVKNVLMEHPLVDNFHDGDMGSGSWGATLVNLKQ